MSEQFCDVGRGITLCSETFGDPADPTALLIMGLGTQMIAWQEDFCEELAGRGLHVVRFDNRDIGHSTHLQGPAPTIPQLLLRSKGAARYTLADMAEDTAGLLLELELDDHDDQPWHLVREKEPPAEPMTVDDALFHMELLGHDFYLFQDKESGRPSVVYRRRAYDYGVISLAI